MKEEELDARGLQCPLPVLKARKQLKAMTTGQCLRVFATDPGSQQDFEAFCESQGHLLLENIPSENLFTYLIQKG